MTASCSIQISPARMALSLFFFNDTATTEIYTLSLHDALPILNAGGRTARSPPGTCGAPANAQATRSEEHTSELQSRLHLVCRLLLEKKKNPSPPQRATVWDATGVEDSFTASDHRCASGKFAIV